MNWNISTNNNCYYYCFGFIFLARLNSVMWLIIYMKIHYDWLRAVQFFFKQCILIGQLSKKLTDGQSSLLLSNQAHALDGAVDGVMFSWFRDTCAFLLLNHLETFSCTFLISPTGSCNLGSSQFRNEICMLKISAPFGHYNNQLYLYR